MLTKDKSQRTTKREKDVSKRGGSRKRENGVSKGESNQNLLTKTQRSYKETWSRKEDKLKRPGEDIQ